MSVGIYKIVSPSGKVYIGQSWQIEVRFNQYKNLSCKSQPVLYKSLLKYGFEAHNCSIITSSDNYTQHDLDRQEREFITLFRASGVKMLNISNGGNGAGKHAASTIQLIKAKRALQPPPTLGKFYAVKKEKVIKPRTFWVGRKHTEESKARQSAAKVGTQNKSLFKLVLNTRTGIYYDSLTEAANSLGIKMPTLSNRMVGKAKNNTGMIYV